MTAGTLATPGGASRSEEFRTTVNTFVLVHGAWHGGWCWRRVADLLERRGHKVFAPTMTGLGERSHLLHPKVDLATHVTDIVNVIKWEGLADIVLVGHSYGGFIISGVAEQVGAAIGSIVFLDAFVPEDGDSLIAVTARRAAIEAAVRNGETSLKPVPAAAFQVNENDRRLGRCQVHAASDGGAHRQDHPHRRARAHRQEGLYPRHRLSQCTLRRRTGEGQGTRRLAHLRNGVRA